MGKRALITGSSSGIGLEFARIFAREGYDLVLVALEGDKLEELKREISGKYGVDVFVMSKDLTIGGSVQEIYEGLERAGIVVDILVNNAGFGDYSMYWESDWAKQEKMVNLNVLALAHLTRLFLPGMVERGFGKILNLASNAAFQPGPGMSVYFASKAFVLSFSEALSEELKATGVTVTALCPGSTKTPFNTVASGGRIKLKENDHRPEPWEVAEFGYRAMVRGERVAIHGFKNAFIIFMVRFMPRSLVARLAGRIQAKKFQK